MSDVYSAPSGDFARWLQQPIEQWCLKNDVTLHEVEILLITLLRHGTVRILYTNIDRNITKYYAMLRQLCTSMNK